MKKRGLKSPDRADALVLTFGEYMVEPDEHIMTPTIGSVSIKR
jgi:phage terminase large subunit